MKSVYRPTLLMAALLCCALSFGQTFTLLKDIVPGSAGSFPSELTKINGTLYFRVQNGTGYDLWRTDGTSSNTVLMHAFPKVKPVFGENSNPNDKTTLRELTNVNGTLFFAADDGTTGPELYKLDASGNVVLVKDIVPNDLPDQTENFSSHLTYLTAFNDKLVFQARDHVKGTELWISDGTTAGTNAIDIVSGVGNSDPMNFTVVGNTLYFSASTSTGRELWKSDGTAAGTIQVADINPTGDSNPSDLTNVDGTLYFTANNGVNGKELYRITSSGNAELIDINPGAGESDPSSLTEMNKTLFLNANAGSLGNELYSINNSQSNAVLVKDIFAIGNNGSGPNYLTNVNGTLYFAAYAYLNGSNYETELWKSDGTEAGTVFIKDIFPGGESSEPRQLTAIGDMLYFTAKTPTNGRELWKSDGTTAGTVMAQEFVAGTGSSNENNQDGLPNMPYEIVDVSGKIFIVPTTPEYGSELWVTNTSISLPIHFTDFKGHVQEQDDILEWTTEGEHGPTTYEVERSVDGKNFTVVGKITSAGNSNSGHYSFKDQNISALGAKKLLYRIKEKDTDGRYYYSKTISLLHNAMHAQVALYPNPVEGEANLMISLQKADQVQWQLLDNAGRVLKQSSMQLPAGNTTISVDASTLLKGAYFINIQSAAIKQQIKMIKK